MYEKLAYEKGAALGRNILGNVLLGGALGGTAGGISADKGSTMKGMGQGALAGAALGGVKGTAVDALMSRLMGKGHYGASSALGLANLMTPVALVSGSMAGKGRKKGPEGALEKAKDLVGMDIGRETGMDALYKRLMASK